MHEECGMDLTRHQIRFAISFSFSFSSHIPPVGVVLNARPSGWCGCAELLTI